MNSLNRKLWVLLAVVLMMSALPSCSEDSNEIVPAEQDHDYYPLQIGQTTTFQVDSIFYDGFTKTSDTFSFLVRNTIVDTITDLLDRKAFLFLRESDNGDGWKVDRQFTVVKEAENLEEIDLDVRTVRMRFPVQQYQRWDGNLYNIMDKETYRYTSIDEPEEVLDTTFDKCAVVLENNRENVIEDYLWQSTYAREIGLIERYQRSIERKNTQGEYEQGFVVRYRIIKYQR